jgi:hypothetical protein
MDTIPGNDFSQQIVECFFALSRKRTVFENIKMQKLIFANTNPP